MDKKTAEELFGNIIVNFVTENKERMKITQIDFWCQSLDKGFSPYVIRMKDSFNIYSCVDYKAEKGFF